MKEKRLFGTNGVRGVVGERMTPELVLRIGQALGAMRPGPIAVGRDTRTSGPVLVHALKSGLLASGCDVVDCGVLPTPALQFIVRDTFAAGAMVTASHNPPQYNGVKVIEHDGTEMGDREVIALERRLFDGDFALRDWMNLGTETLAPDLVGRYLDAILARFPGGIGEGMTVAVDPGSGPAALTTPALLRRMGCEVHTINGEPDGTFPGRLPEPTPDGLAPLADLVLETGAAFGVAHDGDADRAVFVDDRGRYVEENHEFALIARHVCRRRRGVIVTPVSTSQLIEDIAEETGCTVRYTPVGSIYVARTMLELIRDGVPVAFGGEGNGGLIYPDHQFCRDGGMTAATMVGLLAGEEKRLSELLDGLPPFHFISERIETGRAGEVVAAVESGFPGYSADRTDGIRISKDRTWALVRPSGTEPIVRVMVEAPDRRSAEAMRDAIRGRIAPLLD
ncbi:MAG: phosphoglucosamine mutase [Methanospirillum sp.]|nr:phosphoglucosamine mutase [Methanospirillum sp.]